MIAVALATFAAPATAHANYENEAKRSAAKEYWQNRYRDLIAEAGRLRQLIAQERELYADANRRNYRRGRKRHIHREAVAKAEKKLATVEAQLATLEDDARRAGAQRGWLNQVEIELEDQARRPTVSDGPDDGGRNPLYHDPDPAERNKGRNPLYLESAD